MTQFYSSYSCLLKLLFLPRIECHICDTWLNPSSMDFVIHVPIKGDVSSSGAVRFPTRPGTCSELFQIVPIFEVIKQWCYHNTIPSAPHRMQETNAFQNQTINDWSVLGGALLLIGWLSNSLATRHSTCPSIIFSWTICYILICNQ